MTVYKRTFAPLIYIGGMAVVFALGHSMTTTGTLFCLHPFDCALRRFGIGTMAAGLTMWVAACRTFGGRTDLNPLFNILIVGGLGLLTAGVFSYASDSRGTISLLGLTLCTAALIISALADIFDPVHPCKLSIRWPEGGTDVPNPYIPAIENHRPQGHTVAPQDLTRIKGIGPRIQRTLYEMGMISYLDIANYTPENLKTILDEAQPSALVDTESWPLQAQLASQERWEELEKLQDHLTRGRQRKP